MLLYFFLGMIFIIVILPLLESLTELLQIIIENIKCKFAINITKSNQQVKEISEAENIPVSAIGFHMPNSEEEDFYDKL